MHFRTPSIPFSRTWSYNLLPTSNGQLSGAFQRSNTIRVVLTTLLSAAAGVVAVWGLVVFFRHPPYSPLDNFQNLNHRPIIHEGYPGPPSSSQTRAVVSSLYSDSYAIAVAVLGHSIAAANISARLVLPYLEDRVSEQALCIVRAAGWEPIAVPHIAPPHNGKGIYERFNDNYTKLNIWGLDKIGIEKAVYVDADALVVKNFEELFDSPFDFAAVPDVYGGTRGYTIAFNAGVLAFRPSTELLNTMKGLLDTAKYPPVEAEQAFLNVFFSAKAVRLPYAYNANLAIKARSPALWDGMKGEMRIVHYTLRKPFVDIFGDSSIILTYEEQLALAEESMKMDHGIFVEEIGWWVDAYKKMIRDERVDVGSCFRNKSSRGGGLN